jgi:glutaredoxin-like YruB-family protein
MKAVIYTTPTCTWCKKAKEYLKKNSVDYEEVSVDGNQGAAKELMKLSGQMGVPVTKIGEKVVVGFDEEELKAAIGK